MKDSILTIRVSDEQKLKLEEYSYENDISISEIIRNMLDNELSEPEVIYLGDGRYYDETIDRPLLESHNFTSLIFWLYDKSFNPYAHESNDFYKDLIDVINQISESRLFGIDLVNELEKVKIELQMHLKDDSFYKFTFPHREAGFDYQLLSQAFHVIKFNSDNEEVVKID